jgi:hypothetical protein
LIKAARRVQRKESGHDEVAGVAFDFLNDGDLSKKIRMHKSLGETLRKKLFKKRGTIKRV